jgi:hypothetical protein
MTNNQGIMHAAITAGGMPLCRRPNAHMSTTIESFRVAGKQCKRCAAIVAKMDASAARKEAFRAALARWPETFPAVRS